MNKLKKFSIALFSVLALGLGGMSVSAGVNINPIVFEHEISRTSTNHQCNHYSESLSDLPNNLSDGYFYQGAHSPSGDPIANMHCIYYIDNINGTKYASITYGGTTATSTAFDDTTTAYLTIYDRRLESDIMISRGYTHGVSGLENGFIDDIRCVHDLT
jgi:hypothetical protein